MIISELRLKKIFDEGNLLNIKYYQSNDYNCIFVKCQNCDYIIYEGYNKIVAEKEFDNLCYYLDCLNKKNKGNYKLRRKEA
jgi:hypothetical protein